MLSIIVVTYNRFEYFKECIESIENQVSDDFEVVVIDNSDEEIASKNRSYTEGLKVSVNYHKTYENIGAQKGRILGACISRYKYIAFLDDDDKYTSNFISNRRDLLKKGEFTACFSRTMFFGNTDLDQNSFGDMSIGALLMRNAIISSSNTIRKDAYFAVGGHDVSLVSCQDWDLWLRIINRYTDSVVFLDIADNQYRVHDGPRIGLSRNAKKGYRQLRTKHLGMAAKSLDIISFLRYIIYLVRGL